MLGGELRFPAQDLLFESLDVVPVLANPYATEHVITPLLLSGRLQLDDVIDVRAPLADARRSTGRSWTA